MEAKFWRCFWSSKRCQHWKIWKRICGKIKGMQMVLFINLFIHSFTYSFNCSFIYSFIHLFIYSFVHPSIHSCLFYLCFIQKEITCGPAMLKEYREFRVRIRRYFRLFFYAIWKHERWLVLRVDQHCGWSLPCILNVSFTSLRYWLVMCVLVWPFPGLNPQPPVQ